MTPPSRNHPTTGMSRGPGKGRHRAWRFGRLAEAMCTWRLRLCGYRIMARGFRTPSPAIASALIAAPRRRSDAVRH